MTVDTPLTDTLARLQQDPVGKGLYAREQADDGHWETVVVLRDEVKRFASLGPEPAVEFRSGAFDEGGVVVLPILLRLGTEESGCVYDTWLNAYQIEGQNIYLQDLARQDHIRVHLHDEAGRPVHTVTAPNPLRELATAVLARQANYQPSTAAAFEYARERFYAKHPGLHALWQALELR